MKTLVSAVLTLVLITGIPACVGFGPNPCGHINPFFRIDGIPQILVFEKAPTIRSITATDTATFEAHFFQITFATSFFSEIRPTPKNNNWFMNTAYATSCVDPGSEGSKEGVDSIFITTIARLDSTFAAGDTINSIVDFSTDDITYLSHSDFVKANKTSYPRPFLFWKLTRKPANITVMHSVRIILKLTSGEVYTSTSIPFFFR